MELAPPSFIVGIEAAMKNATSQTRAASVRQITEMFISSAETLTTEQIEAVDHILLAMIDYLEIIALVELSEQLAPVDLAPPDVVKRLASHDEISVAKPVLTTSRRLHWQDLEEIASTQSHAHLLAIASRQDLDGSLTDVLLDRGDEEVAIRIAENSRARFSRNGYTTLVKRAEADARLAVQVGLRLDLPLPLHRQLLIEATEAVRSKLLERAPAEAKEEIHRVLDEAADRTDEDVLLHVDFVVADGLVRALHRQGRLDSAAVLELVQQRQLREVEVAIALLCSAPVSTIAEAMTGPRNDVVVACCRAANLDWLTTRAILCCRNPENRIPMKILRLAQKDFDRLSPPAARQIVRTMQVRSVSRPASLASSSGPLNYHG